MLGDVAVHLIHRDTIHHALNVSNVASVVYSFHLINLYSIHIVYLIPSMYSLMQLISTHGGDILNYPDRNLKKYYMLGKMLKLCLTVAHVNVLWLHH